MMALVARVIALLLHLAWTNEALVITCTIPADPTITWIDLGVHMYQSQGQPVRFGVRTYSAAFTGIPCNDDDGVTPNEAFCEVFTDRSEWFYQPTKVCGGDER